MTAPNQEMPKKIQAELTISTVDSESSILREQRGVVTYPQGEIEGFNARLILSCCTFGASAMLFGYDDKLISSIASLEAFIVRYQGLDDNGVAKSFTAVNQILLFSVPLIGAIVGAIGAPILNSRFGRKKPLLLAYVFSLGATFLELFAPTLGAFVAGRFWNAIAMGISIVTAPLYLSEVVPYRWRGAIVTSSNILNLMSGVIATVVVNATERKAGKLSYMIPLAIQCCTPILLIPMTIIAPESPYWLVSAGRLGEARANLKRLRSFNDISLDKELRVIQACEDNARQIAETVKIKHLFTRPNFWRTITAGSVFSLNQVSGIILSTTFATIFLVDLGVAKPFTLSVIASCCVLAGAIVGSLLIDRIGRRPLALYGMTILLVIDVVAGGLAFKISNPHFAITIAILSFFFNFTWAASFYSISILLPTEIPTPKLRNMTMSYSIICAYTTAIITTFSVPLIVSDSAAGLGAKAYLIFAGFMMFIIIFYYIKLPETSGRSFVEIDEMFLSSIPVRKWTRVHKSTMGLVKSEKVQNHA